MYVQVPLAAILQQSRRNRFLWNLSIGTTQPPRTGRVFNGLLQIELLDRSAQMVSPSSLIDNSITTKVWNAFPVPVDLHNLNNLKVPSKELGFRACCERRCPIFSCNSFAYFLSLKLPKFTATKDFSHFVPTTKIAALNSKSSTFPKTPSIVRGFRFIMDISLYCHAKLAGLLRKARKSVSRASRLVYSGSRRMCSTDCAMIIGCPPSN